MSHISSYCFLPPAPDLWPVLIGRPRMNRKKGEKCLFVFFNGNCHKNPREGFLFEINLPLAITVSLMYFFKEVADY